MGTTRGWCRARGYISGRWGEEPMSTEQGEFLALTCLWRISLFIVLCDPSLPSMILPVSYPAQPCEVGFERMPLLEVCKVFLSWYLVTQIWIVWGFFGPKKLSSLLIPLITGSLKYQELCSNFFPSHSSQIWFISLHPCANLMPSATISFVRKSSS